MPRSREPRAVVRWRLRRARRRECQRNRSKRLRCWPARDRYGQPNPLPPRADL